MGAVLFWVNIHDWPLIVSLMGEEPGLIRDKNRLFPNKYAYIYMFFTTNNVLFQNK